MCPSVEDQGDNEAATATSSSNASQAPFWAPSCWALCGQATEAGEGQGQLMQLHLSARLGSASVAAETLELWLLQPSLPFLITVGGREEPGVGPWYDP